MQAKIVINGSGISGLLSALLLCRKGDGSHIYLVDKNTEAGGLLRRFRYGEWGDFDYGMHNVLETGIAELDQLVYDLLPPEEWQLLEDDKRDLAGIFFNGKLQLNSPYFDLRSLSPDDYADCLAALFAHFQENLPPGNFADQTAYDYAVARFGKTVAEKTIIPSVEKIHRKKAEELDFMATVFTPMTRVAFCDEPLVGEITQSEYLRNRIAWSDQRSLPNERASGRKAMYPVKYGIYRVVEALLRKLQAAGVHILTETEITGLEQADGKISSVLIRQKGEAQRLDGIGKLVWTANIPLLARYLGYDFTGLKNDKPLKTIVVNLVVDRLPEKMGDLYYYFCYDPAFRTYRLTNFSAYCRGAARNGGYPLSMELLLDESEMDSTDPVELAKAEYFRFGIAQPDTRILFAKAEILDSGFPMPSRNNITALRKMRGWIRDQNLENIDLVGILAEDNLFFQTDVLRDAYQKLH